MWQYIVRTGQLTNLYTSEIVGNGLILSGYVTLQHYVALYYYGIAFQCQIVTL